MPKSKIIIKFTETQLELLNLGNIDIFYEDKIKYYRLLVKEADSKFEILDANELPDKLLKSLGEIDENEILKLMTERKLTIEKVINTIIDANHVIGVGLVTLAETLYLLTLYNPELRKEGITKAETDEVLTKHRERIFQNKSN